MNFNDIKITYLFLDKPDYFKESIIIGASLITVLIIVVTLYILIKRGIRTRQLSVDEKDINEEATFLNNNCTDVQLTSLPPPEGF